ncbi:hypothetical protein [Streptomyces sp. NPDC005969]|uniref:hypothetical protein n=1 Tax=Streptomyces sp. NPDC005969 TaxID=3156722 RepID=UPI0033F09404
MVGAGLTALASYLGPLRTARSAERQNAIDRQQRREDGAIERLIAIRSAYREWDTYLRRTAMSFRARGDSVQMVTDRISALMRDAQCAGDAAMRDGWWVGSEGSAFVNASDKVMLLVAGEITDFPDEDLDWVRACRNGLNERILERLETLLGDAPVVRYSHD